MPGLKTVGIKDVRDLCLKALTTAGVDNGEAVYITEAALDKDLQDDHLRGVTFIPGMVSQFKSGQTPAKTTLTIIKESGAYALTGGTGNSRLVCAKAMGLAIDKARKSGLAMVMVKHHSPTMAPLMKLAVEANMIGFGNSEGPASIAPTGGTAPLIGNNPIGFGIPADKEYPIILDMSFSQSSVTPVQAAAREGRQVAPGLLVDADGNPTTDPNVYLRGKPFGPSGSFIPIGGYKGYALAMCLGVLTTSMIGMRSRRESTDGMSSGTFFMAIDVGQWVPLKQFKAETDELIKNVRGSRRKAGTERIFYPGEHSQELQDKRRKAGTMELPEPVLASLEQMAKEMRIPFRT